jgi:hypothetical protein
MTRRLNQHSSRILAAGFILASGIALGWLVFRPHEPSYGGRSLSDWLYNRDPDFLWIPNDVYGHIHDEFADQLESGAPWPPAAGSSNWSLPEDSPRRQSLEVLDTNAIPWLLDWMASEPRPLERLRAYVRWKFAVPFFKPGGLTPVERRHVAAFEGFAALGRRAEPALPALSNLLSRPHPDLQLGWAIASVGPQGIAVLTHALTNSDPEVRDTAALSLGLEASAATSAVPTLLRLTDGGQASYHVLGALGRIGCDPALAVPPLTRNLERLIRHETEDGFNMTVLLLGLCGDKARPALPLLLRLHAQSDPWTQKTIRAVIRRIDPQVRAGLPPDPVEGEPREPR